MSGVNLNSLSTKFNVLEKSSPKSNPIIPKGKEKEEVSISSASGKETRVSSKKPEAAPEKEKDSFSKELEAQESKSSYGRPTTEAKPSANVPVTDNVPVEEPATMEVNPLMATKKKTVAIPTQDVELLNGKKPILKFLDSMERELGIEPEKILAAFSAMSNEALILPPEQSTEEFVGALNLQQPQIPKARSLYSGLLEEMARQDVNAKQKNMQLGGTVPLKSNEWNMLPEQQALPRDWKIQQNQLQNQNVTELSNKFFNVSNVEANNTMSAEPSWLQKTNVVVDPSVYAQAEVPMDYPVEGDTYDFGKVNLNSKPQTQALQVNAQNQGSSLDMGWGSQAETELGELSLDREMVDSDVSGETFGLSSSAPSTKLYSTDANAQQPIVLKEPVKPEDIVQKADLLVKKGGGEMKMKLNPEGLGEVHLKVTLQEGKVDVQMITESQQAKKAIESELQGLKAVLSEGKMDLRDIKVDVSQNLGRQMQEQLADQQRENARQFLNYFRENFGSGRNAMAYSGGTKMNNSQSPEEVVRSSASQRRANREPGRLSVVA